MPQWAGSCWYYLRFIDPKNNRQPVDPILEKYWMPVDLYVGGAEHAVLHLLYARFWHKVLFDLGLVSTKEPFQSLRNQGMILGENGDKMSKSRGNVVNPDHVVDEFGADSLRVYEMFMGPLEQVKPWQTSGIQGVRRFLDRVHSVAGRPLGADAMDEPTAKLLHRTVKKVGEDIEALRFNTAVSAMMILVNHLAAQERPAREAIEKLLLILSPFAPHLCEELWEQVGLRPGCVADAAWPEHDERLCIDDVVEIAVQVNGKVRGRVSLGRDASEEAARAAALEDANVARFVEGKTLRKLVYVPGRIINLIVG